MGRFTRARGKTTLRLDTDELQLLMQAVNELIGLLDDGVTQPFPELVHDAEDPFSAWEASFGSEPSIEDELTEIEHDPVERRLFPPAYPDDPAASSDFQRFTQDEQRRSKIRDAMTVLDDLESVTRGIARIPSDHYDAWMKTLNNLRLVLSVMLGITDEISNAEAAERPDEDPRAWLFTVYSWLGWMLESLLECVLAPE